MRQAEYWFTVFRSSVFRSSDVVATEVENVKSLGVKIETNVIIGKVCNHR